MPRPAQSTCGLIDSCVASLPANCGSGLSPEAASVEPQTPALD